MNPYFGEKKKQWSKEHKDCDYLREPKCVYITETTLDQSEDANGYMRGRNVIKIGHAQKTRPIDRMRGQFSEFGAV